MGRENSPKSLSRPPVAKPLSAAPDRGKFDSGTTKDNTVKKKWPKWVPGFLKALAKCSTVLSASHVVGLKTTTAPYELRREDPAFAAAWDQARIEYSHYLEAEADRRGVEGLVRKKFDRGQPVIDPKTGEQYCEREYSDTLLIFRLKALNPQMYRDNTSVDITSGGQTMLDIYLAAREAVRNASSK